MLGEQIPLQQWSSFFSIISAASATLLGLLFVVITIAPGIGRQLASKTKVYLTPEVIYLTSVLIMSALLTVPNQTLSAVLCICTMGIFGLISELLTWYTRGVSAFCFRMAGANAKRI